MSSPTRPGPGRPVATEQPSKVADVALELFLEHGYDATPMSRVAKQCGLTKAGIYHHFESKEQLLYYLHKRHIDRLLLPMIDEAAKITDPEERLRRFLSDYAMLLTRDPTPRLLISETKRLSPEHTEEIREAWRRGLNLVREAVQELQARDGNCSPRINSTYAAFAAIGMTSWICNWFDHERPETGKEVARTMIDVFLEGLLPRNTP